MIKTAEMVFTALIISGVGVLGTWKLIEYKVSEVEKKVKDAKEKADEVEKTMVKDYVEEKDLIALCGKMHGPQVMNVSNIEKKMNEELTNGHNCMDEFKKEIAELNTSFKLMEASIKAIHHRMDERSRTSDTRMQESVTAALQAVLKEFRP